VIGVEFGGGPSFVVVRDNLTLISFKRSKDLSMDDGVLLNQLEELAGKVGIEIRYGKIDIEESHRTRGLCRVQGKYFLIMHSRLTAKEKIGIIIKTLKGFEMEDVYVMPVIRELLDKSSGGRDCDS
jgi:hypothetical protein